MLFGISVLLLAHAKLLPIALIFMTFTGIGMMAQTSAINTFIQTHAAPNMRSRAISYYVMAYQGMIPIGSLLIGLLANAMGPRVAMGIEGIVGIASALLFIMYRNKATEGRLFNKAKHLFAGN